MINKIIKHIQANKIIILIGTLAIVGTTYYLFYYQSPEECFLQKIQEWDRRNKDGTMPDPLWSSDPKTVTAFAKVFLNEFSVEDMSTKYRTEHYMALGTYVEYCKVK